MNQFHGMPGHVDKQIQNLKYLAEKNDARCYCLDNDPMSFDESIPVLNDKPILKLKKAKSIKT